MRTIFLICIVIFTCSCSGKKNKNLLPPASGRAGDVLVVMDSAQWKGEVGKEIRKTFRAEVQGLPREEYLFKLNYVDPRKLNDVLKSVKNLVFVMTTDDNRQGSRVLRNYFTKSSLDKIEEDPKLFVFTASDEFSRGQKVMYLFGQNSRLLSDNIKANRASLQNYFNKAENDRLFAGLYKAKESRSINEVLEKEHDFTLRIPFGYRLVLNEPGFVWFRQINAESDKNIFVTYRPYTSESDFDKESIIAMRDSIAKNQLFEDPADTETYILTETAVPYIPVTTQQFTFKDKYAVETRGLWKTNNFSMGGPFVSYTVLDPALNRLYYLEGFVYSPGKNQREFMRELEVILSTFDTKEATQTTGG